MGRRERAWIYNLPGDFKERQAYLCDIMHSFSRQSASAGLVRRKPPIQARHREHYRAALLLLILHLGTSVLMRTIAARRRLLVDPRASVRGPSSAQAMVTGKMGRMWASDSSEMM